MNKIKTVGQSQEEIIKDDNRPLLSICVISSEDDWTKKGDTFLKYLPELGKNIELRVLINRQGDEEFFEEHSETMYFYIYTGKLDYGMLRNKCKELATGHWILSLDMDEILPEVYHLPLIQMLNEYKNSLIDGFKVGVSSTGYDLLINEPIKENIETIRIFKNKPNINYFGSVHEIVDFSIAPQFVRYSAIQIIHLGYDLTEMEMFYKFKQRYLQLLDLLYSLDTEPLDEQYKYKFIHYSSYLNSVIEHLQTFYKK